MPNVSQKTWMYLALIFIIIALTFIGITFYQYISYQTQYSNLNSEYQTLNNQYGVLKSNYEVLSGKYNETLIKNLAYDHWLSIVSKDINSLMSQYSSNAIVYWFKGPLAGNYTMNNVTRGSTNTVLAAKDIKTLWIAFFNNKPVIENITNLNTNLAGNNAVVKAVVSFLFTSGPREGTILKINYELDYTYTNGKWVLYAEWWTPA
ncbi:MAG: hypothetical protein ACP5IZ_02030 [Thermoprotei archaeon]